MQGIKKVTSRDTADTALADIKKNLGSIKEDKLTTTPYATALQDYLKDNPIQICLQLAETIVENIEVPRPLMALEPSTVIELNDDSDGIHPKITVEVPIIKGSE